MKAYYQDCHCKSALVGYNIAMIKSIVMEYSYPFSNYFGSKFCLDYYKQTSIQFRNILDLGNPVSACFVIRINYIEKNLSIGSLMWIFIPKPQN